MTPVFVYLSNRSMVAHAVMTNQQLKQGTDATAVCGVVGTVHLSPLGMIVKCKRCQKKLKQ